MKKQAECDCEKFETDCRNIISAVLSACEAELAKRNDNDNNNKALPYAALAVLPPARGTFFIMRKNKCRKVGT